MLEELEDDTHLCIKCSSTIIGLENYVRHRKSQCSKNVAAQTPTDIDVPGHPYREFEFPDINEHHASDGHIMSLPANESPKVVDAEYKTETEKSAVESDLGADFFFSLLNLQSSAKHKQSVAATQRQESTDKAEVKKSTGKKGTPNEPGSSIHENIDEWIDGSATGGTEKLMKAVNEISGTKKPCYEFKNNIYSYEYSHDSPEPPNEEEDEDEDEHDEEYNAPPHTHTGGKWKPSDRAHRSIVSSSARWYERWDTQADNHPAGAPVAPHDDDEELQPPPTHTKGKWVPGTKITKLDYKEQALPEQEFTEQLWCNSCNRKLSSRAVYERHLRSKLHLKHAQPEKDLEKASLPLPRIADMVIPAKTTEKNPKAAESINPRKKRNRLCNYIKCSTCKTRLRRYLYGKHLISHYHYRRMSKKPHESYVTVLKNIHRIVLQSPFQCQPCRFYVNTHEAFLQHWDSLEHFERCRPSSSRFWCSFCKFECDGGFEMRAHLVSAEHLEVVLAINRSVPIIIRRRTAIACGKCHQEFLYNIELRRHAVQCSDSVPVGTGSDAYQSKHRCADCSRHFKSISAVQRHMINEHQRKLYFCGPCNLTFADSVASRRHRVTTAHKVNTLKLRSTKGITRQCKFCGEVVADLLELKSHLRKQHPSESHPCYMCGENYVLPQELSRHIRDEVCRQPKPNAIKPDSSPTSTSMIELPIVPLCDSDAAAVAESRETECLIEDSDVFVDGENYEVLTEWGCEFCEFHTSSESERIFHTTMHEYDRKSIEKIPCPICSRIFGKSSLRCHLRLHTNERIYPCDKCSLSFTRKYNLKDHIRRVHLNETLSYTPASPERLFECPICRKIFKRKSILDQHMHCHRDVIAVKVFQCPEPNCLFNGRSAAELRMHQTVHIDEKSVYCDVAGCNYRTKTTVLLRRHHRAQHSDAAVQMFKCKHCLFSTKVSSHVKRHERIHSGVKPFKCPHCDYESNNQENLRKHVISTNRHPGRFLYECKHCAGAFATNNTKEYQTHLQIAHKRQ